MRPIDADSLKEKKWDADTRIGYVQVVDVGTIDEEPTIDLHRHGHWIPVYETLAGTACMCSVCHCIVILARNFRYCPDCAAVMDEDRKEK